MLFHIAPLEKVRSRDNLTPEDFTEELNMEELLQSDKSL